MPARGSLKTYLYSAARNLSLKHFRNTARETAVEEFGEEPSIPVREAATRQVVGRGVVIKGERGRLQFATTPTGGVGSF